MVAASLSRQRLGAVVLIVFGFVSLTLAAVGTYGLTSALDPWVLVLVPPTMLAVTLLASYVPERRASKVDVCAALREN